MEKQKKIQCRYQLDDDIRIKINIQAATEDVSASEIVERAVRMYLERKETSGKKKPD